MPTQRSLRRRSNKIMREKLCENILQHAKRHLTISIGNLYLRQINVSSHNFPRTFLIFRIHAILFPTINYILVLSVL